MFVSIELYTFLEVYIYIIYAGKIYNLCGEDLVIQWHNTVSAMHHRC